MDGRRPATSCSDKVLAMCFAVSCSCDEGYYGHDCARRRAGLPQLPSRIPTTRWLADVVVDPPAAREPPPKAVRRRLLVYVYDLEPMYQAKILQYRWEGAGGSSPNRVLRARAAVVTLGATW